METGPRDRLFEAEMRRLDALAPYKDAVRGLASSARCDPGLACALHRLAARSQKWTLVAAGIDVAIREVPPSAVRRIATEYQQRSEQHETHNDGPTLTHTRTAG